jgi:DNA-binding transcriptional LysR family regulator
MLSLEQVAGFVAVAEELHVGRAAERLSMTQPPLSRRIQMLERELGVLLFERTRRGMTLTAAGRAFLMDARRMLHLADDAAARVRRVPRGELGTVSVGFTAATAYTYLGQMVELATRQFPDVDLVLREMVSATQIEALHDGTIDLGLLRPPVRGTDLRSVLIVREPLLAALPAAHPALTDGHALTLADFDAVPMVMYQPTGSTYFHDLLRAAFAAGLVQPDFRQFVTQVHTALSLVRAGVGWAVVPSAARLLSFDGVSLIPVRGLEAFPAEVEMAWRTDRPQPARDALVTALTPSSPLRPQR